MNRALRVQTNQAADTAVGAPECGSQSASEMIPTGSGGEARIDTSFGEIELGGESALHRSSNGLRMAFGLGPPSGGRPVEERVEHLLAELEPRVRFLRWGRQVHGTVVASIAPEGGFPTGGACVGRCDALMTAEPGLGLIVWTADCVPILLEGDGIVAAVHSGWRGTAGDIIGRVVRRFEIEYGVPPHHLQAALGPAICGRCYEVGTEVIRGLGRLGLDSDLWRRGDRVDLRVFLRLRLHDLGLKKAAITMVGPCTAESDHLASFRRDGAEAGRQYSLIYRI